MALRNIVTDTDHFLRKKSRPVDRFDERLHVLLDDMAETMYHEDGVGLAAVQVGVLRRVVVIDVGDGIIELVNPQIIRQEGEQEVTEGCLSCPGTLYQSFQENLDHQLLHQQWQSSEPFHVLANLLL